MNTINPNALGGSSVIGTSSPAPNSGTGGSSFGDVLESAFDNVNELSDSAAGQVTNLLQGGGGDVSNVMIAVEKADVSFQMMMAVRNKIVNAYQEIEKMQF